MFTFAEVRQVLRDVVEERPDYVDPGVACSYVDREGDAPSCLIGHALYRLGASLEVLSKMDQEYPSSTINNVSHPYVVENFDDITIRYMREVQTVQDNGYSWGTALDAANGEFMDHM